MHVYGLATYGGSGGMHENTEKNMNWEQLLKDKRNKRISLEMNKRDKTKQN